MRRIPGKQWGLWVAGAALLAAIGTGVVWAQDGGGLFGNFDWGSLGFGDLFKSLESGTGTESTQTQAAPEAPLTPEEKKAVDKGLTRDYRVKAENSTLVLWFDPKTSNLAVEDKRNGNMWRSAPDLTGKNLEISGLWQDHLQSPFIFNYTQDFERSKPSNTKRAMPEMTMTDTTGPDGKVDGVKVHYKFTDPGNGQGIELTVIYRILGDELVVTVPYKDIKDGLPPKGQPKEAGNYLESIEMLPFLGAASNGDDGYAFYPDGSGAITYFNRPHQPEFTNNYSEFVYGPDDFPWRIQTAQTAMLPVFGMVQGKGAFLGIIREGEASAKINFSPSGYNNVPLYRNGAELVYRREYQVFLRRGTPVQKIAENRIPGDREIRYIFLDKKDASYSGMAMRYRRYLMEEGGVKPIQLTTFPLHLRLFMGIQRPMLIFQQFVPMTTFKEAEQIVENLRQRGVAGIDLTLVGWNRGGWYANWPRRFPIPSQLGGASGLKALAAKMKELGVPLYLEDNYVEAWRTAGGFSGRLDVVRAANKLPVYDPRNNDHLLLSPKVALRMAQRDIPKLAELGVTGEELLRVGELMFPDYNSRSLLERDGTADTWMQIAQLSREKLGRAAAHGANAYLFGHVDALRDVPMRDSGYVFADESVPFLQMVLHGLIPYSGETANLRYDARRQFLREIEYGAIPVFELTWQSSTLLSDTEYNRLFTSEYRLWADRVTKEYKEVAQVLGPVMNEAMVQHQQLADQVYKVTYEDGTSIIVNYRETPYDEGGVHVDALGYTVLRGGVKG